MNFGNWIPVTKEVRGLLPHDRPYTELEAIVSLQLDYDQGTTVTVQGYASLWGWSRGKVRRFLEDLDVEISYPKDSQKQRNQRGHILIHKPDISSRENGHKRIIDSKWLASKENIPEEKNGHKTDIRRDTTIDPNPDPIKKVPPDALRLSGLLADLISENNPSNRSIQPESRERSVDSWAIEMDRMLRIDKRPVKEAEEIIRWCQRDSFWKSNILSGKKLRDQYDKLLLQMSSTNTSPQKPDSQDTYRSYQCP